MYRQKGTARGIINAVRFFLGVEIEAVTAYAGEALVLGESELGVDWILGPSSRFARYAFDVIVVVPLTDAQRKQLRAIVEYLKPAHTHFVTLVEPAPPAFIDHWEFGVSEVGVTGLLAIHAGTASLCVDPGLTHGSARLHDRRDLNGDSLGHRMVQVLGFDHLNFSAGFLHE